jgi:hypothetical protein
MHVNSFHSQPVTLTEKAEVTVTIPTPGGTRTAVHEMYLTEHKLACCEMILGRDFMRNHIQRISIGKTEIRVRDLSTIEGITLGPLSQWGPQSGPGEPTMMEMENDGEGNAKRQPPSVSVESWNELLRGINALIGDEWRRYNGTTGSRMELKVTKAREIFPLVHSFYHHHHGHTCQFYNQYLVLDEDRSLSQMVRSMIAECETCQRNAKPLRKPHTERPIHPRSDITP